MFYIKENNAAHKKARIGILVKEGVVEKRIGKVLFHASFPEGHKKHIPVKEALRLFVEAGSDKKNLAVYKNAGGPALLKLINFEHHNGVEKINMKSVSNKNAVVLARFAEESTEQSKGKRGRPKGSTSRSKEQINSDKALKELRINARKANHLPPRGRLTVEQQTAVDKYIAEHSANPTSQPNSTPVVDTPPTQ